MESIFNFADRIKSILPNLKFTVVHGQMDEKVMEYNVMGFYQGQTDVLISTTIIENGIDLPKANTIIVIAPTLPIRKPKLGVEEKVKR